MADEPLPPEPTAAQREAANRLGLRLGLFVVGVMVTLFAVKAWLMVAGR